jgi:hypothetical protein
VNANIEPCRQHKPKKLGYVQWCNWAEAMTKQGKKQTQCPKCKLWFFEEEM